MQYTDNEATLIGGLISNYFFQPAVDASLKDAYGRVLEHLHQNICKHMTTIHVGSQHHQLLRCDGTAVFLHMLVDLHL